MIEKICEELAVLHVKSEFRPVFEREVRQKALMEAMNIVREVAKEYDAFDVIYKKVCELEKRYDEDSDVGNVNGCIRLENLLQCFKEELKAPYQKGE